MRRRAFIGILSAAVGLPVVSLGQQTKQVPAGGSASDRRIFAPLCRKGRQVNGVAEIARESDRNDQISLARILTSLRTPAMTPPALLTVSTARQ